jgi:iron complex outermembrane receptor protein
MSARQNVSTQTSAVLLVAGFAAIFASPPAAAADELTEIFVTVRQRSESIQDVPGAVTAFSSLQIEQLGIKRAEDFIAQTPGVSIVNAAEVADTQVNIRGINGARDAETNYALIIDGVLMTNPAALNREYTNLSQIEILKGPQGALYGRNAAAGAIIITTERPGLEWGGKVLASIAQDSTEVYSGTVGGPVSDTLGLSLTGSFRDSDGYYRNAFYATRVPGSEDTIVDPFESWDIGARLVWEATNRLTVDTKVRAGEVDAGSITFNSVFHIPSLVGFLETAFGFPANVAAFANENVNGHPFQFDNNIVPFNDQESLEFSVKADYDLGWADLTAWGLYSDIENELGADGTSASLNFFGGGFLPPLGPAEPECVATTDTYGFYPVTPPQLIVPQDFFGPGTGGPGGSLFGAYSPTACDGTQYQVRNQEDYSFEVRFASKSEQPLRWLGGIYYLNIDREVGVNTGMDRGSGITQQLYVPNAGPATPNPTEQLVHDQFDTDVYAVFGQLAYDVTETVEASLALRYDREEREVRSLVPTIADGAVTQYIDTCGPLTAPGDPNPINAGLCFGPIAPKSETFDEIQPKLSVTWDALENLTAYASWGVGFKSGGFNNQGAAETIDLFINDPLINDPGSPFEGQFAPVNIGNSFREETSDSIEVGAKSNWIDGRLRTEVALYTIDVDDMQFFEFVVGGFGLLRVVSNIDKVEIDGIELSANFVAADWLDLFAGVNVISSEIKRNNARPDSAGNDSPYTPDYTWNAGAQLRFPVSASLDFIGGLDFTGIGDTWFHVIQDNDRPTVFSLKFPLGPGNYAVARRDAYALANLRAGVGGDNWTVVGFVDNFFDEAYLEEVIPAPEFGGSFIHPGSERRAGVEATFKF